VEWYFGYRYPHTDLTCEDFRSRSNWWKQSTIATQFIQQFPLEEMKSNNSLVNAKGAFCLEKPGEIYLIYLPAGTQNSKISLPGEKTFSVKWFNPREGGEMQDGNVTSVEGKGFQTIGNPPVETEKDWVVVLQ
ncbi:MAG TPA: putative collagen-binding domain-containing protein, partial [Draconibacterium sp.]|nr:putative collagen-binding domain-containing protein [Draconibacterium sp.]